MLVATARGSMTLGAKEASISPHAPHVRDSRTMFPPMAHSSTKAIQWSTLVISP